MNPYASIREMGEGLRKRQFTSVDLTKMYLERLKTLGKEHNAVALVLEEDALDAAKAADARMRSAKSPLHGVPFGVKDLLSVAGHPTEWGSPGHKGQQFPYSATVVERLQDAGAVLIGKLATIELAGGGNYNVASASVTGPALCAWDKARWAGGSSSGSGASTALGCVGFSIGTETSGSITCPCAFNGCTGFRPTYGRVPRFGAMALCWSLDKIGPICRSAEDGAAVLETIAGYDPRDPASLTSKLDLANRDRKLRIGLLKEDFAGAKASAMERAYQQAIDVFKKLGYEMVEVAYPKMPYELAVGIIVDAEGASAHENFIRSERFQLLADIHQVAGFAAALETRATDYIWAMRLRTEALRANEVWERCDCIFTPVFYHAAVSASRPFDETWHGMGGDDGPSNLLGWPALAFPVGFETGPNPAVPGTPDPTLGTAPLGCQIIAPAFREDVCLRVVRDFQRQTDWHSRQAV
jgi:aspartyl-tRNA(Asn)/glutamyl-tRNA(Gln) amidotransferase subunit A